MKRKRIIIVSTFSGMDLLMLAFVRASALPGYGLEKNVWAALMHAANFKYPDGTPVMQFVKLTKGVHVQLRANKDDKYDSTFINGEYIRGKRIEEANGTEVRVEIERKYGKDIFIILLGGPPCQDLSKINRKKREGERNRNKLLFEYARFLRELNPDVALMEEAEELCNDKTYKELFDALLKELKALPFNVAHMEMNSLHYGSNQQRVRTIIMMTNKALSKMPVFPEPDLVNVNRVRDFLGIEYYHSGSFTDKLKTSGHFMCTVTSGAPAYFIRNGVKVKPTTDELLWCFNVLKGEYTIPSLIPKAQVRKAIANAVCTALGQKLAETIFKRILCVKHVGDGWFEPIDSRDHGPSLPQADNTPLTPEPIGPTLLPGVTGKPAHSEPSQSESVAEHQNSGSNIHADTLAEGTKPPVSISSSNGIKPQPESKPFVSLSKRIITSDELLSMEFDTLGFTDKWNNFFGNPSILFNAIVHGMAGEGKSTFACQFAKYLADNHGKTLYISGEEGFSKTLKDKVLLTDSSSNALHWAELKSSLEILREVQPNSYPFIFIDSLQHLNISAQQMRELRAKYKNTAFICISQATKAGEMRGSNELAHDSDIIVKVEKGLAITTKNRFKEKGINFNVFEVVLDSSEPNTIHNTNKSKTTAIITAVVPVVPDDGTDGSIVSTDEVSPVTTNEVANAVDKKNVTEEQTVENNVPSPAIGIDNGTDVQQASTINYSTNIIRSNGRIIHGDCMQEMAKLADKSVDMILTDLPYGLTTHEWDCIIPFDELWKQWKRVLKPNGIVLLFASGKFVGKCMASNDRWFKYMLTWVKNRSTNFANAKRQPLRKFEQVLVFYKKPPCYNPQGVKPLTYPVRTQPERSGNGVSPGRSHNGKKHTQEQTGYPSDVLYFPRIGGKRNWDNFHPTQKPVELLRYLIRTYTNPGDTVLDCSAGSMSTGVAALHEERKYVMIEKNEEYFRKGKERIERHENDINPETKRQ